MLPHLIFFREGRGYAGQAILALARGFDIGFPLNVVGTTATIAHTYIIQ